MTDKERQLYCGNLSEKVTEDILYELFLQAGPLESVTIPKDKDGKPRRYAFVTFKHAVSVPYTLALMNGMALYGKPLNLDARTGAKLEHNPFLERLNQYRKSLGGHQNHMPNRSYNQRENYEDNKRRYDSRWYESRPEAQQAFKHAVSVPYSLAVMNGMPLYGKPLNLDARTGAESEHNPFLERLNQCSNSSGGHQNHMPNRSYNQQENYEDNNRRYDSRWYESRPEAQRVDVNMWNKYPVPPPVPYGVVGPPSIAYPPLVQSQTRFLQNSMPQAPYQYGSQIPWSSRNHR